jgi:hypothetical protein
LTRPAFFDADPAPASLAVPRKFADWKYSEFYSVKR